MKGLGSLADPTTHRAPVDLGRVSLENALQMLEMMALIRAAEEEIAEMVEAGEVKCPCHLAIGQEATPVGISHHLRPADRAFGSHRSHGHYLAAGGSLEGLMAEVLGKATGASKGMGGSMHLFGGGEGAFAGSVPIVAGTVPIAVGAAMAAKMDNRGDVAVAYFGDGSCEEGVVHESLNLAAVQELPVIFVVENNLYSSHLDINFRQPSDRVARFAEAHGIATSVVDGNDVVAVAQTADKHVKAARNGHGPAFIEAVTFRWRGHVGPDENIDVGLRRSAAELAAWKKRDPIARLQKALFAAGVEKERVASGIEQAQRRARRARKWAYEQPDPLAAQLLDCVYAPTGGDQ